MAIGSEPVKPAPQKPTTSTLLALHSILYNLQNPHQRSLNYIRFRSLGKPYDSCTKSGCNWMGTRLDSTNKGNTQRAMQKIKNIGKYQKRRVCMVRQRKEISNTTQRQYEQAYLTPEQTTHKATADLASHEFRVQQGFLSRMSDNSWRRTTPDVAKSSVNWIGASYPWCAG